MQHEFEILVQMIIFQQTKKQKLYYFGLDGLNRSMFMCYNGQDKDPTKFLWQDFKMYAYALSNLTELGLFSKDKKIS